MASGSWQVEPGDVAGIWTVAVLLAPAEWINGACHNTGSVGGGMTCTGSGSLIDLLIRVALIAVAWGVVWLKAIDRVEVGVSASRATLRS